MQYYRLMDIQKSLSRSLPTFATEPVGHTSNHGASTPASRRGNTLNSKLNIYVVFKN
jgi:hypothetical protein